MPWQISAVQKNISEAAKLGYAVKVINLFVVDTDRLVIRKYFEVSLYLPLFLTIWNPTISKSKHIATQSSYKTSCNLDYIPKIPM